MVSKKSINRRIARTTQAYRDNELCSFDNGVVNLGVGAVGWGDEDLVKLKAVGLVVNLPPNNLVGEFGDDIEVSSRLELNESTMPWTRKIGCRNCCGFNIFQGFLVYLEDADEIPAKVRRCDEVASRVQNDMMNV